MRGVIPGLIGLALLGLLLAVLLAPSRPAPEPPRPLSRVEAETLNRFAARFCALEAYPGEAFQDVLRRLRACRAALR